MKELFEQFVHEIWVSPGESTLFVRLASHQWRTPAYLALPLDADCCSESWYADIIGVKNLLGEYVIGIERLELPEPTDNRSRQEHDQAYGYRLRTTKGDADIIFRNSSNGYYGGSMLPAEGVETLPDGSVQITSDWQAGAGS